jgi:hypothetical protein
MRQECPPSSRGRLRLDLYDIVIRNEKGVGGISGSMLVSRGTVSIFVSDLEIYI